MIIAKLPTVYKNDRRTIQLDFKDREGLFFKRNINLTSDEFEAIEKSFFTKFVQEQKEREKENEFKKD